MKRHVRVYIEGGAEGRTADRDFRRGWKKFLNELHELARANDYQSLEIVRGKSRGNAFRRFTKHKTDYPNDLCVLLADAETEVPDGAHVWDIVAHQEGDKWQRPSWVTERHLYLMVHFVETWLLTDQDALKKFFKQGFNQKPLPTTNLETRSKDNILQALKKATQSSKKGPYQHGQAHEIIEIVRPDKVRTLWHGRRLFDTLGSLIRGEPET
ncbi:DUF4276 family protein [candidate division KSB1 bacterium]|nr:DUF4276 family protein [candidate division KSB1 bacterium]